ncbi:hypothetical protein DH2020_022260 [Rehmannia glutinosa]|uniref:DUF4283 domain-containing protein n=1 Tax=Rehmannia glutinosa TaxID=99300 RepID=A0ABR0WH29_REHGL
MADFSSCPPEFQTPKLGSYANVTASSSNRSNLSFDPKRVVPVGTHQVRDGKQVLGFTSSENDRLAASWKLTLNGKFSFAIPHPKGIDSGLSALNLKGPFSWSFANPSHIIIKLQIEEDFNKLWMGTLWSLGDCPMRVFKWTPSFNPRMEAPLAPVWIRLPGLPIHLFDHNALFSIGLIIGKPLQVDSLTAARSRLSMARVCVELDLLKERIDEIILEFDDATHAQKIIYERIPDYCTHCKHIGHSIEGCYKNGNITRPPPPVRRPPPPVRRPTTIAGPDGHDLKGLNGNTEKTGTSDKSKSSKAENPNPSRGAQRTAAQNQDWIQGPDNAMDLQLDDQFDPNSVEKDSSSDVAIAEISDGSQKDNVESTKIPYSMGDNSCLEVGLENNFLIANKDKWSDERASLSFVNGVPTHSLPTLPDTEKDNTHGLHLKMAQVSNLNIISTGPHTYSESVDNIGKNLSPSLYMKMAEKVGDNMTFGAVPFLDLDAGVNQGDKGNYCGSISINISPQFSKLATLLDDLIGQQETPRNLHASGAKSTLNSLQVVKLDHKSTNGSLNPSISCPTATSQVGPKIFDDKHNLASDNIFINGTKSLSTSPCATSSYGMGPAPHNVVGPDVFLSPLTHSTLNSNLVPPHHLPSAAVDTPSSDDGLRATLGHRCCLNEAQLFSSTPAQSSSAANGPTKLADHAHSAESACAPPSAVFVDSAHQTLDPVPLSTVYVIKEVGLIDSSVPNYIGDHLNTNAKLILDEEKIDTKLHKDGNCADDVEGVDE